jgi:hypothetical protein
VKEVKSGKLSIELDQMILRTKTKSGLPNPFGRLSAEEFVKGPAPIEKPSDPNLAKVEELEARISFLRTIIGILIFLILLSLGIPYS